MEYVRLGRSGLKVSRICLGTNMYGAGYVDDERAVAVIKHAFEQGINFLDTADVYNAGRSEEVVGRAVKDRRHDFVVATKGCSPMGPGVNDKGLSRKHLMQAVEASLRRLGTDYIDLYQAHAPDPETPLEETLSTLDDLVRQGKVRYLGCSNHPAWRLCRALWVSDKNGLARYESAMLEYNFGRREAERDLFPLAQEQQVGLLPFQVLMGGLLTGAYDRNKQPPSDSHLAHRHAQGAKQRYWNDSRFDMVDRLKKIAAEAGYTPTQMVLAWSLSKPAITSVIAGASKPEQVALNAQAATIKLPPDVLNEMDSWT
jgi:aryl-alcohol dehydrogenase-like predicted oxidoreductase